VHELSIAQSLLEIVLEESRKHGMTKVRVIRLQVGELAAVVPDSLLFCFEMISENTAACGAIIEIETVPVVARCSQCQLLFQVENHVFVCPECQVPVMELVSGRDLSVMSVEGEREESDGAH